MEKNKITKEGLLRFNAGEESGMKEIFNAYYAELCFYANKITKDMHEAEDIVQKVMLNFWTKCRPLQSEKDVNYVLYALTRNASLNYIKSYTCKLRRYVEDPEEHLIGVVDTSHQSEAYNETLASIRSQLNSLPARCKEVIMLQLDGVDAEDIGASLGITRHSVYTHRSNAVEKLKIIFKRK